jgi:hypothetical protein
MQDRRAQGCMEGCHRSMHTYICLWRADWVDCLKRSPVRVHIRSHRVTEEEHLGLRGGRLATEQRAWAGNLVSSAYQIEDQALADTRFWTSPSDLAIVFWSVGPRTIPHPRTCWTIWRLLVGWLCHRPAPWHEVNPFWPWSGQSLGPLSVIGWYCTRSSGCALPPLPPKILSPWATSLCLVGMYSTLDAYSDNRM